MVREQREILRDLLATEDWKHARQGPIAIDLRMTSAFQLPQKSQMACKQL